MDEWSLLSPPLRLRKHFGICGRKKEKAVCKCHLGRDTAIHVLNSQKMQLPVKSFMTRLTNRKVWMRDGLWVELLAAETFKEGGVIALNCVPVGGEPTKFQWIVSNP